MNKKGNWTLPAIFGIIGILLFLDAIAIRVIIPMNRLLEGFIGLVLIILAIILYSGGN